MRLLLLALAVLLAPAASGQPATVTGRVLDAETREPLAGASVYLSGTTLGDAADADGRFSITSPVLGEVTVVASMVGYAAAEQSVRLGAGRTTRLVLRPRAQTVVTEAAVVDRPRHPDWQGNLDRFRTLFLGETPNARATHFWNPEVLTFTERGSVLQARASSPLTAVHHRLGYQLRWESLAFEGDDLLRRWSGDLFFEPSEGDEDDRARWAAERRRAYNGSWRHFLDALRANQTAEEGFEVFPVRRPGRAPRVGAPISADSIATARSPGPERIWLVLYYNEFVRQEARTGSYRLIIGARPRNNSAQRSWVTIGSEGLRFGEDGRLANPLDHVLSGYWDYERAADLLPLDYDPLEGFELQG